MVRGLISAVATTGECTVSLAFVYPAKYAGNVRAAPNCAQLD
jgi:hypothetical protein